MERLRGEDRQQKCGTCLSIRNISSALAGRWYGSRRKSKVQSRKEVDSLHPLQMEAESVARQSSPKMSLCRAERPSKKVTGKAGE